MNDIFTEVNLNLRYTLRVFMDLELHAAYMMLGDYYDSPEDNGGSDGRPEADFMITDRIQVRVASDISDYAYAVAQNIKPPVNSLIGGLFESVGIVRVATGYAERSTQRYWLQGVDTL